VRNAEQLLAIADRHPGIHGPIEAKYLHVQFLNAPIAAGDAGRVTTHAYLPDTFEIDGREIYLTYPEGSGRSKLTIEVFERAFGVVATARNLNTVRALADLARTPPGRSSLPPASRRSTSPTRARRPLLR
jgi:uncharacterized protein (DUF1697 family)